ncbi:MAG: NAD(P)/FAD-dependent oxidoreductase [Candidatus Hodarchaeales archaeon]
MNLDESNIKNTGDEMPETRDEFDVIVVGGGPAGLSAGIVASYKGLRTAVFEGGTWGGLLSTIYPKKTIHNYPGVPAIRAGYLVAEWIKQAADNGVHLIKARIVKIYPGKRVETELGDFYGAKAIIIATGTRPNELGIPGEARLSKRNKGVYPYVTDPENFIDQKVLVVGGGDTAIDAVIDLSKIARKIILAHRKKEFRASEMNVAKIKEEKWPK